MNDLNAAITISAVDAASSVLRSIGGTVAGVFNNLPGPVKAAAGIIGGLGLVAVGVGAQSVSMAADFQQSMLKVQSLAGYTAAQMNQASQAILEMAGQVGKSPKELADGLFYLASAGFRGSQALSILKLSAQAAATGGTSVKIIADGLSSALNAFSISGDQAGAVMDMMTRTVSAGKMQFADYANVIGKLSTVAKASGVSFDQANAALATMTNSGYSAQYSSTLLSNLFTSLDLKTDALAKHAKSLGISFDENKFKSMTLAEQIRYLDEATKGNSSSLLKLLGNNATALKTYEALKNNLGSYNQTLNSIKNSQGAAATAFAIAQQGFNQQMAQSKAAVDALMIRIGTALLPVITKLMAQISPLISRFTDWAEKHHVIENAGKALIVVIDVLGKSIGGLVTGIARIVEFFQHNQLAADTLKAALAGLAAGVAAWLATLLPGMIAGFIAWAGAAGAAAIATLAAAWTFILIGLIVGAVVLGIILAVRNWGAITGWLQGVWSGFSSWFMSALRAVGDFFHHIWDGIVGFFQAVWAFLVNAAKVGAAFLLTVILGPFLAIGALFVWLYNHNYYFKAMIDAIVHAVQAGIAWLHSAWLATVGFVAAQWQRLVGFAESVWSKITATIKVYIDMASAAVQSVWNFISGWLSAQWNLLHAYAAAAWLAVSQVFSGIWNTYIAKPLNAFWSQLQQWFASLGKGAADSGRNFINMLASAITSGAGAIWNAVVGIAQTIWKALGFHSPAKAGPGADADKWMPNLVSMLSSGLTAGIPKMQAAVSAVAQPLAVLNPAVSRPGTLPPATPTTNSGATIQITINVNVPFTTSRSQAQEIARVIEEQLSRQLRRSGNLTTWTSGGKN